MNKVFLSLSLMIIFLSGCASVTVTEEFQNKMEFFSEDYYVNVMPEEFRIRHTINSDNRLKMDETKLRFNVTLKYDDKVTEEHLLQGHLIYVPVDELVPLEQAHSFGFEPEQVSILKLNDEGISSFREIQHQLESRIKPMVEKGLYEKSNGKPRGNLSIGFGFMPEYEKSAKPSKSVTEVLFSESEGYITMTMNR
jgi:hypothetical protein